MRGICCDFSVTEYSLVTGIFPHGRAHSDTVVKRHTPLGSFIRIAKPIHGSKKSLVIQRTAAFD